MVFAKHGDIFKGNSGTCLKRLAYTSRELPEMTVGTKHCKTIFELLISLDPTDESKCGRRKRNRASTQIHAYMHARKHTCIQYTCTHANTNVYNTHARTHASLLGESGQDRADIINKSHVCHLRKRFGIYLKVFIKIHWFGIYLKVFLEIRLKQVTTN